MTPPPVRAVIVDDEEPARENLRIMLADECPWVTVVGTAHGHESALEAISDLNPDLLFLDIRMPSGTEGLDLLADISDPRFMVIFVTAFKDHAVQAFHANAVDYILKPIDPEDLINAVRKAEERRALFALQDSARKLYQEDLGRTVRTIRQGAPERLAVDHARGFKLFEPREIARLEADGNCTLIHFRDGSRYLDTRTLKVYEDLLCAEGFVRVHRTHLINMEHLQEYLREDGHWAIMKDGSRVPIARDRVSSFLDAVRG